MKYTLKFTPKGFTLIELLIFMGIFSVLLLFLLNLFTSILDVQLEAESYSSVDLDGRYILAKLSHDIQSADSADTINNYIDLPATGSAGTVLRMRINSQIHTYFASTSGRLQMINPTLHDLTSSDSSISALLFERIGPGDNTDTIRVSFRLTSRYLRRQGAEFRDFQTTLGMP
jgi:prepilin-type N-terminal cleavage/methylation domain-containing protein